MNMKHFIIYILLQKKAHESLIFMMAVTLITRTQDRKTGSNSLAQEVEEGGEWDGEMNPFGLVVWKYDPYRLATR